MYRKKKGAMELSINTIIVVVIGITLLTLGIVFVRSMFTQLDEISKDTFDSAKTEINKMHGESKFSVPSVIKVKQGSITTEKIYIGNDGSCSGNTFSLIFPSNTIDATGYTDKLQAEIISKSASVTIEEGYEAEFVVQVASTSDASLTEGSITLPSYKIQAKCGTAIYANSAFVINVVKGSRLF